MHGCMLQRWQVHTAVRTMSRCSRSSLEQALHRNLMVHRFRQLVIQMSTTQCCQAYCSADGEQVVPQLTETGLAEDMLQAGSGS